MEPGESSEWKSRWTQNFLSGSWKAGHVKRAADGISISPRGQASTEQAALPDATSALVLTVFRSRILCFLLLEKSKHINLESYNWNR